MFGGIGKIVDKALDVVKNPLGSALDIASGGITGLMKEALEQAGGSLFGGMKSLGDLLEKLRTTDLGKNLTFPGVVDGKETPLRLDSGHVGLPPHLAELQPAVDGLAQLIGGDSESAKLLADLIGGAIGQSKNPAEALANLEKLAETLGLDKSAVAMMLEAMKESGLIPNPTGGPLPSPTSPATSGGPGGGGGAAPVGGAGSSSPKTPLGGTIDGAGGFLYKPFSDSNGNLVVLTPERLAGQAASVTVRGPDGSVLATGTPSGNGNGGRDHFRFDRPGSDFPPNISIEVTLRDGSSTSYPIANPSLRYD